MTKNNVFQRDRLQGKGGGVLFYVKNTIACKQMIWPNDITIECVGIHITLSSEMSFTVNCLYRQPSAKVDFYD